MAWLPTRGDHSQGQQPARGGHSRAQPARRDGRLWPASKGQLAAASPTASRGSGVGRKGGRPLAGRLSAVKGSRRQRRGSDNGGVVRVKEGYVIF
ncbi:hypothetical protein GW17_00031204 [Ensete ventricosum]|nr:hypothetical protein GW17_00031204 [Ensete ventricosum]